MKRVLPRWPRVKKTWPVLRLIAFDHCRTLAPWCAVRRATTPLLQARKIAHELEQARQPRPSPLEAAAAQLLYLIFSLRQILLVWRQTSTGVKKHYHVSRSRQLLDLFRVVWHANLSPRTYYFQRLFRHPDPAAYLKVIDHRELQLLLRALHRDADTTVLDDKVAFHAFCARHDITTPAIIAQYSQGQCEFAPSPDAGWKIDLFTKPARSYSSRGIACWRYDPISDTHTDGKARLDRAALQSWLAAECGDNCLVVQPRLENSGDLASISAKALANCRVVTARDPGGHIRVLLAVLRMGVGEAITSDEPSRSFCTAVDPETGTLGIADAKQAEQGSLRQHPGSGAPITGRRLSRWPEMKELALRAHASLPQMIFIGWDVIDTDQGPMLLEGNVVWGGNLAQMAGNLPLGATGFPEIFLHYHARGRVTPADGKDQEPYGDLLMESARD